MQRTFIAHVPDHPGAFLEVCRITSDIGANITRVNYNKAVDSRTLFLDARGTREQLDAISEALSARGLLQECGDSTQVLLLDFALSNAAGAAMPILTLIDRYDFQISYINAQSTDQPRQTLRIGLRIEDPHRAREFMQKASELCEVRAVDRETNNTELDNAVFYIDFVNHIMRTLDLDRSLAHDLMIYSNAIMQNCETRNESPFRTFRYITRFAEMLAQYRGAAFWPCVDRRELADGFQLYSIQPPCGSNTWILQKDGELLFVDCGFAIYGEEMLTLLRRMFPDFDHMHRRIIMTHPDMDHAGLLFLFDEVYVSPDAYAHFALENAGKPAFRERDPMNAPYCRLSRILHRYVPPKMDTLRVIRGGEEDSDAPIAPLGEVDFCGHVLRIYRGNGGHTRGEIVIVDDADRLLFTGDIMVNIPGFSPQQAEFNKVAPYLLSSVNLNSRLATLERRQMQKLFPRTEYAYCCGHGAIMDRQTAVD